MRRTPALAVRAGLSKLAEYPFHVLTWVDDDGTVRYHHDVYGIDEQFESQRTKFEQRA